MHDRVMWAVASALPGCNDTIAAIATAPGRSGIAVIRVSGTEAFVIAGRVTRPWPLVDRRSRLCALHDPLTGELLDRAVVSCWRGPRSYTGEDVVELSTHGGSAVPAGVLAALIAAGARMATAGEFTRRALLHGRFDLLQAEAVADLVEAKTSAARRVALNQADGGLSRRLMEVRESVLGLEALVAYDLDFPDEDDGPVPRERILAESDRVMTMLGDLAVSASEVEMAREGATVVIAGLPNVGKSSLFNALLGTARAIVAATPGTTRDALEAVLDTQPWPLRLVDTAGLRETADTVERLGIEVSERSLAVADAVLCCGEDGPSLDEALSRVRALTPAPIVAVLTKQDLPRTANSHSRSEPVRVSAERGTGLGDLVKHVTVALSPRGSPPADIPRLTRVRHRQAVDESMAELRSFRTAWAAAEMPAVIAAVHLRTAVTALETLIGAVGTDDVLDHLFGTFCIGK
ncbi:MAG: tRNA uridine-5-carboxymethylaminomethyl(34) synthesis GTPase MnmE [Gemmatimonadaceae bacterium]